MAVSSVASKFTVRQRPAVLVVPAAPTPHELKPLSDIDDQPSMRVQVPAIMFYRGSESMGGKDPAQLIRDALAEALVHYYPLAGRLRELDEHKLAVDCTAEGVFFIEADADVGLDYFGEALLPPFPCLEELIFDVPGSSAIVNTPLMLFQLTRLACGGFILAVRANHAMTDALGLTQFLGAVAELARGAQALTVPPVWERELLDGRRSLPPQQGLGHGAVEGSKPDSITKGSSSDVMLQLDDNVPRPLFFGPQQIAAIRGQLSPHLQKRATTFDMIAGWLWKSRTSALAMDPSEMMVLSVVVNARGRKTDGVGIPVGYYGNAFATPVAVSTAGELCKNPVSYAVELVRKAKSEVDMEYMRSMADLVVLRRGQRRLPPAGMYSLSDQTKARFDDLDFGWGTPVYAGAAEALAMPSLPWLASFLLPFKDGIVVPICLPGAAMDRLVEEMDKLLLERPSSVDVATLQLPHLCIRSQEVNVYPL